MIGRGALVEQAAGVGERGAVLPAIEQLDPSSRSRLRTSLLTAGWDLCSAGRGAERALARDGEEGDELIVGHGGARRIRTWSDGVDRNIPLSRFEGRS